MYKPQKPPFTAHKEKIYKQIIKTGKFIYQIGESENLRKKSREVNIKAIKSLEFRQKTKYVKDCLKIYRKTTGMGRGITAVQVGIQERFSVVYIPEIKGEMLIIINPVIKKISSKNLRYPEICMSANPIIANVVRPSWIEFEYYDENGVKQLWDKKDTSKKNRIYNRVFQHEIDHMDGIINIDKVLSKDLILESDPKFYDKARFVEV